MTFTHPDSPLSLPLLIGEADNLASPSPLEVEVVQFFDELRDPLLHYAVSMGLRVPDSEEIVQEVFLALFRHLKQGKPRTNLRGWIFRVGHNLALKRRARNIRRDRLECAVGTADNHIDPQLDPEEEFAEGQRRQHLRGVVEVVPELDRSCLYLRAEGLRYREIAEVLGISLGGVSLALGRALRRLGDVDKSNHEER